MLKLPREIIFISTSRYFIFLISPTKVLADCLPFSWQVGAQLPVKCFTDTFKATCSTQEDCSALINGTVPTPSGFCPYIFTPKAWLVVTKLPQITNPLTLQYCSREVVKRVSILPSVVSLLTLKVAASSEASWASSSVSVAGSLFSSSSTASSSSPLPPASPTNSTRARDYLLGRCRSRLHYPSHLPHEPYWC